MWKKVFLTYQLLRKTGFSTLGRRVVLPFLGQEAIVRELRLHTVSQPFTNKFMLTLSKVQ